MASYRYIDDFSVGDTYKLIRTLDPVSSVTEQITDAYWTVKSNVNATDQNAELSVHITETTGVSGIGEVTNYPDGSIRLQFIATPEASNSMSQQSTYYYDIHVNLVSGEKYMLESGKLFTGLFVTHVH
jgi:hypothetical protein